MDDIGQVEKLIDLVRDNYVSYYTSRATDFSKECPGKAAFEIAFEMKGSNLHSDLMVVDMLCIRGDGQNADFVIAETLIQFNQFTAYMGKTQFTITPFTWDSVKFVVSPFGADSEDFQNWFDQWIDLDATRDKAGNLLGNRIHAVEFMADGFVVDFGSASTEAWWHINAVIAKSGADTVTITQNVED